MSAKKVVKDKTLIEVKVTTRTMINDYKEIHGTTTWATVKKAVELLIKSDKQ